MCRWHSQTAEGEAGQEWSAGGGREQCAGGTHKLQRVKQDRSGQQEVAGSNVQVALTSCRGGSRTGVVSRRRQGAMCRWNSQTAGSETGQNWAAGGGREQCAGGTHKLQSVKQDRSGEQEVAGSNVQVALTNCRG